MYKTLRVSSLSRTNSSQIKPSRPPHRLFHSQATSKVIYLHPSSLHTHNHLLKRAIKPPFRMWHPYVSRSTNTTSLIRSLLTQVPHIKSTMARFFSTILVVIVAAMASLTDHTVFAAAACECRTGNASSLSCGSCSRALLRSGCRNTNAC